MRANITHHSRRRIRLRIPDGRRNEGLLRRVAEIAGEMEGVESTESNSTTGSVLIRYAARSIANVQELAEALGAPELGLEVSVPTLALDAEELGEAATSQTLNTLLNYDDSTVRRSTGNKLDFRLLIPLGAACIGVANLSKRNAPTPLWVTMMIFAFTSLAALDRNALGLDESRPRELTSPAYLH